MKFEIKAQGSGHVLFNDLPDLLSPLGGGFYFGLLAVYGQPHALVVAPKDEGETEMPWGEYGKEIEGADSFFDGLANTNAMAAAGSELGKWARALRIGGHDDWHIPARDSLELGYRHGKPNDYANFWLSGDNPSSIPVGYAYRQDDPAPCAHPDFKEGGAQAFAARWHWSSTQSSADYAWSQTFGTGYQLHNRKGYEFRARAVRLIPVSH